MTRRRLYIVAIVACAAMLAAAASWRWIEARELALREAEARADEAARAVAEVLSLRGQRERASLRAVPKQDIIKRISDTLAACGVDKSVQWEVAAEASVTGAREGREAGRYTEQVTRLSLRNIRLADLGKVLSHWRQSEPLWTISGISLVRVVPTVTPGTKAPPERFDTSLVLSAPYVSTKRPGTPNP
jgi:hypothetical protein